ncbi:hypothetical protein C8T65DRAFT_586463 [Cerioporus squamosus]|nr:hypothetical protein C8T65DRAFT_586463 [Cerioporus squamosus]
MLDFPRSDTFAVVRMDPVAMVQHLNDPEALRAAEALSPQSYLVYLHRHNPLCIGGPPPWHGFDIYPIATSLRPPNEDDYVTPEMCTPIFPNSTHPEDRTPLRTLPAFPFDNCYFWSGVKMKIRICPRPEGFKWDDAMRLPMGPGGDYLRWTNYEREDAGRQFRARQALQPQPDPIPEQAPPTIPVDPEPINPSPQADGSASSPYVDDGASSVYSDSEYAYSCTTTSSDMSESSDLYPELTRLFADPVESPELHPLCHLWCDLADNIKQDEIASPVHLFEERDAIVR